MVRCGFFAIFVVIFFSIPCADAVGAQAVPPPDFESGHQLPKTVVTEGDPAFYEYMDVAVLVTALFVGAYLILKRRNRRLIFCLMVFSLIYFGFWRKGCICPIGAIGNITLSIFESEYSIPIVGAVFFFVPLVFTLFFGRIFCGAVCPLGALQDLVLLRPILVPRPVENALRLFAYVYLGAAVLFAATGSAFVICRYDPFVAFFRISGNFNMLILGGCVLVVGLFVGRPYCRFFCPYGVILRQLSRLSKWRVTITPDECIKCRLCEDSCPFGAIREPTVEWADDEYFKSKKLLAFLLIILPVLTALFGWVGSSLSDSASRVHETVRLAERIYLEDTGGVDDTTDASLAFRGMGETTEELYDRAGMIKDEFVLGGWVVGGVLGLICGLKLIGLTIRRSRSDYEAERAGCLACGRCFSYCPREHVRLKEIKETAGKS